MGNENSGIITICVGRDPRPHGERLADTFARGAESVHGVRVLYTGLASTPSMYEFCRYVHCFPNLVIATIIFIVPF